MQKYSTFYIYNLHPLITKQLTKSRSTGVVRHGKKCLALEYMQGERRDLEYFGKGLTDEQVLLKKKMLKESAEMHPEIAEYFRELAVDFCVRFPEEATRQRETKEWEQETAEMTRVNWVLVKRGVFSASWSDRCTMASLLSHTRRHE